MNRATRMKKTTINDNGDYCSDANSNCWLKKTLIDQNEIVEGDGTDVSNDISEDNILYNDADRIMARWPSG